MRSDEERQLVTDNHFITYTINSKFVNLFRFFKILYTTLIISILVLSLLYDKNEYNTSLPSIANLYILCETIGILVYIIKIKNIRSNYSKTWQFISTLIRFWWILTTIYGLDVWLDESKTTDSVLYYLTAYIFITNLVYMCFSACFGCILYCCMTSTRYPYHERRSQTFFRLVDDVTDIQLFSNILKMNMPYFQSTCTICLENFENDDRIRILNCQHYFHNQCVDEWLSKNPNCPNCRVTTVN